MNKTKKMNGAISCTGIFLRKKLMIWFVSHTTPLLNNTNPLIKKNIGILTCIRYSWTDMTTFRMPQQSATWLNTTRIIVKPRRASIYSILFVEDAWLDMFVIKLNPFFLIMSCPHEHYLIKERFLIKRSKHSRLHLLLAMIMQKYNFFLMRIYSWQEFRKNVAYLAPNPLLPWHVVPHWTQCCDDVIIVLLGEWLVTVGHDGICDAIIGAAC